MGAIRLWPLPVPEEGAPYMAVKLEPSELDGDGQANTLPS
jgi:hypothetical protein